MAFKFRKDRPRGTVKHASAASTLYTIGDPLKLVNGILVAATSGTKVHSICKTAKAAADASTDPIEAYPVRKSDEFVVAVGTGTMADSYLDTAAPVDLKSGAVATLDITASTNDDFNLTGWDGVNTAEAFGTFNDTVF